jgi:hypothetical protein
MRTCQTLIKAEKYLDGSPVYKGDINRVYTSEIVFRIEASVVKAPVGGKLFADTDESLLRVMHKLKFGQIGALKSNDIEISGSEILFEIIVPVKPNEVLIVKDQLTTVFDAQKYMSERTCTINGQPVKLSQLKEKLSQYRETNREIRQRWVEKARTLRARGASSDQIREQKESSYADYVSVSEYSVAINVRITHIVNNPSLKSTVIANNDQAYYDAVNYKEGKVRKIAEYIAPIVSIPIATLDDYKKALNYFGQLRSKSAVLEQLKALGSEDVVQEASKLNVAKVDFAALRKHDLAIK